jgi:hypothetical protein
VEENGGGHGIMNLLQQEFEAFDAANPEVWRLFCRFAAEAVAAGNLTLSASLIFERIRWETLVVTRGAGEVAAVELKLNNNHRAYYARKYNATFAPELGRFATRSVEEEAT